eukprot:2974344-Pyramimonas_sp.AAC.1
MPVSSPVPGKRLPLVRVDMNNGVPGYHLATTTNRNERVGNIRTRPPIRTMTAYLEEDAAEVVLVHGHQRVYTSTGTNHRGAIGYIPERRRR